MTTNLGADQLRLDDISQPAWVWDHDRARIVDANDAALALWQEPSVADLMEREFDPKGTLALSLEREADHAGDEPLEVPLLLPISSGHREMNCEIAFRALKGGRRGLLVTVLGHANQTDDQELSRLADAAKNAPVALLVVDADGHIASENDASLELFGSGRESLLAQRIGSSRIATTLIEETLIHGRASRTRTIPTRIGPRLTRLTTRRSEDPATGRPSILVQAIDVDDTRAREGSLTAQVDALADFLAAGTDFYLELDQDLRITRASDGLGLKLGTQEGELLGDHWRDLVVGAGFVTSNDIDLAMAARSGWRELTISAEREGQVSRFATSARVLTNDRGDFRGYRIVGREIETHISQGEVTSFTADPAASTSAGEFSDILAAAPWAVVIHKDFTPLYFNMAFTELFGLGEEVLKAPGDVPLWRFFPDNEHELRSDCTRLLDDDLAFAVRELKAQHVDGRELTIQMRARRIDWRGESVVEYVLEDVSTYRRERQNGEDRAEVMTSVLNMVPEAILLLNGNGVVDWANLASLRLLGLPDDGPGPHDISDVLCPEDTSWAQDYVAGLAEGGLTRLFAEGREVSVINADGERIQALMALDRISVGDQVKICAVLRDITEWRQAETKAEEVLHEAEDTGLRRTEFLARVSHELRTPLTAILGFAQVMAEEQLGPMSHPRYLEYAKDIQSSGDHLLSLINDLLDMSKIETGNLKLNFGSVDLDALAQSCVRLMTPVANKRQIRLRIVFPDDLPAVVADERSLRQILLNLISNALRFTEPRGQVTVTAFPDESGGLTLTVSDTGVGMSEEELVAALEPFEQIDKAVAKGTPGTGLGLPLARALAEANRAFFQINSAPEAGTTVAITFPSTQVLSE